MKKILIILLIFLYCFQSLAVDHGNIIEIKVLGISDIKRKILITAELEGATTEEKALLLAVASIETEDFSNNYPVGDGKTGDAYNISIYKMNVGMVKDINNSISPMKVQNDVKLATKVMLQGIRKYGFNKFLVYHRGGAGAFDGKVPENDIKPYVNAVKRLTEKYIEDKKQLSPKTTDDTRYTILIPAI